MWLMKEDYDLPPNWPVSSAVVHEHPSQAQLEVEKAVPRLIYLQVGRKDKQWVSVLNALLLYLLYVKGVVVCVLACYVQILGISYLCAENMQGTGHVWKKTWL